MTKDINLNGDGNAYNHIVCELLGSYKTCVIQF